MLPTMVPDWPAPAGVKALVTTRRGGVSKDAWKSLNLGMNCGDVPGNVVENRRLLQPMLPNPPKWLSQIHGKGVIEHDGNTGSRDAADAIVSSNPGRVCAVLTADCLPVLFTDKRAGQVAVAHAGWRGLACGVLESTLNAMDSGPGDIMAWLGPGIGPDRYEVGDDVRDAFISKSPAADRAFKPSGERWLANLYLLARQRLSEAGVENVYGGRHCTFSDSARFFSYRRDGVTGRMASLIWLQ